MISIEESTGKSRKRVEKKNLLGIELIQYVNKWVEKVDERRLNRGGLVLFEE